MLLHYFRTNACYGFTSELREVTVETIKNYKDFEIIQGDPNNQYAVICLSSNIASTHYDLLNFTNDVNEADTIAQRWLDVSTHKLASEGLMQNHYYAVVVDLFGDLELGYGDCWQKINEEDPEEEPWHRYRGV